MAQARSSPCGARARPRRRPRRNRPAAPSPGAEADARTPAAATGTTRARTAKIAPAGALPPARIPAESLKSSRDNRLLAWTLGISLAVHVALLSIHFAPIVLKDLGRGPPLEVALVNAKTKEKPTKADVLAQANLDGGGNTDQNRRARSPLPVLPKDSTQNEITVATKKVEDLEREARELMTRLKAQQAAVVAPPQPDAQPPQPPELPTAKEMMQKTLEAMRLEAQIAKDMEAYQKRPKRRFVGARAEEYRFARYVEDWRLKVERIGNLNYPEAARQQKLYGSLLLTVSIRADGTIEAVEVNKSSGPAHPRRGGREDRRDVRALRARSRRTSSATRTSCTSRARGRSPRATSSSRSSAVVRRRGLTAVESALHRGRRATRSPACRHPDSGPRPTPAMPDRYAVIGNPVLHSKSPRIHAEFARSTGQDLVYEHLLAPLDGFVATVAAFARAGGRGLNVTVPFKVEAFALASLHSSRAQLAGAVNTLMLEDDGRWYGDNTDGAGLVRDLTENLGDRPARPPHPGARRGRRGARRARAAARRPSAQRSRWPTARTTRRSRSRRSSRRSARSRRSPRRRCATTSSTSWSTRPASASRPSRTTGPAPCSRPARSPTTWSTPTQPTQFVRWAQAHGAARTADGLGMLIEQAAESFHLWRGVRPHTAPVFALLRPR